MSLLKVTEPAAKEFNVKVTAIGYSSDKDKSTHGWDLTIVGDETNVAKFYQKVIMKPGVDLKTSLQHTRDSIID